MLKKKLTSLVGAVVMISGALTAPLMAGSFGIGVSATGLVSETSGSQTLKSTSVVTRADGVNGTAAIASGYIQYRFGDNGFVFGIEKIPGALKLGDKCKAKLDNKTSDTGVRTAGTNCAKAEIDNHRTYYIETPSIFGLFAKVGYTEVDLTTLETLDTGSTYDNATLDGTTIGLGFKGTSESGIHVKLAAEYTEYDGISLTSSDSNVVAADVETWGGKLSIGYQF